MNLKFSSKGDIICRADEKADEFYIIRKGKIGVFTSDGLSIMAILEDGAFFGEIGLLISKTRTMTIKCLSETEFLTISKERFLNLFDSFPDEKNYLMRVAKQRLLTTNKHDIPLKEVRNKIFDKNNEFYRELRKKLP